MSPAEEPENNRGGRKNFICCCVRKIYLGRYWAVVLGDNIADSNRGGCIGRLYWAVVLGDNIGDSNRGGCIGRLYWAVVVGGCIGRYWAVVLGGCIGRLSWAVGLGVFFPMRMLILTKRSRSKAL